MAYDWSSRISVTLIGWFVRLGLALGLVDSILVVCLNNWLVGWLVG